MPLRRQGRNIRHFMADVGMADFAVLFTQRAYFLEVQESLQDRTVSALFGLDRIPNANQIRNPLGGVPPGHFDSVFLDLLANTLERGGYERMQCCIGCSPLTEPGISAPRA